MYSSVGFNGEPAFVQELQQTIPNPTEQMYRACGAEIGNSERRHNAYRCATCASVCLQSVERKKFHGRKREVTLLRRLAWWILARTAYQNIPMRHYYEWLSQRLRTIGSVLDVGCGDGSLPRYFRDAGATVDGIEPLAYMSHCTKVPVHQGNSPRKRYSAAPSTWLSWGSASTTSRTHQRY